MRKSTFIYFFCLTTIFSFSQGKEGPVAKYSFNRGDAKDEAGSNHAKEVGVSYVDDRFGNSRSACYFHGTYGSYLNLGTDSVLKPLKGTISVWIKIDNAVEAGSGYRANPIIITKCQPGNDFFEAYCIYYKYDSKRIGVATTLSSLNQVGIHSSNMIALNEWHHIVMTYDNDFLSLYFDGKPDVKISKNFTSIFLKGDSVMVGNSANTKNKRFFNGSIDDIEIYNRVLNPEEIKALHQTPDPNKNNVIIKWLLMAVAIMAGIILIVLIFINRYKKALQKEREKNILKNQMYELEIKAIKAQMNPHFIFNSLNSIQQFILANDNDNAYKYLAKFSKLVRKLLETNTGETVSLEDEIALLNLYVEMESLRFERSFEYKLEYDKKNFPGDVQIPPMLIQPFVENAIWHGLLHKKENRSLIIKMIYLNEKKIMCSIDDNGVGREPYDPGKELMGKKSMAINFIGERLKLLSKIYKEEFGIKIIDKKDNEGKNSGTTVEVTIPILKK